jgi:hypothetical protein
MKKQWLSGRGRSGAWHLSANSGKLWIWGNRYRGKLDSQSPISSLWSRKTSRSHDCRSEKSKLHMVSAINRSLSTRGILSRSTGGGTNGFSSSSACFVLDTISATVPATNNVSGVYWWWRKTTGKQWEDDRYVLWCDGWFWREG